MLMIGGALLLILGVALVWVLGRDDDGDRAAETQVAVLVARADLEAGQSGDDLAAAGKVAIDRVPASEVTEGALRAPTDVAGMVVAADVADGDQVVATDVRAASLRSASITIPKGKQAVAVSVGFTEGGAGYAAAGDQVNLYVNIPPGTPGAPRAPYTKLLLSDVEVLDVSSELAPQRATETDATAASTSASAPRTGAGQLTLLLALDPQQAEQTIFASSQNELWFTVLAEDDDPSTTGGVDYETSYLEGP